MSNTNLREGRSSFKEAYLAAARAHDEAVSAMRLPFNITILDAEFEELVTKLDGKMSRSALVRLSSEDLVHLYDRYVVRPATVPDITWPGPSPAWNIEKLVIESLDLEGNPVITFTAPDRISQRPEVGTACVVRSDTLDLAADELRAGQPEIWFWLGRNDMSVLKNAADARAAALVLLQVADDYDRIVGEQAKAAPSEGWTELEPGEPDTDLTGPSFHDTSAGGDIAATMSYDPAPISGQDFAFSFLVAQPGRTFGYDTAVESLSVKQARKVIQVGLTALVEYDALAVSE